MIPCPSTQADWSEAGIFRAAFLAVFDPADHYRAAVQDARALAAYLAEVRELATEADLDHRPAAAVARDAEHWQRELEEVVAGMEADLRRLPGD